MNNPVDAAKKMMAEHSKDIKQNERIESLKKYDGDDSVISSLAMMDFLADNASAVPEWEAQSGIPKLDNLINGFRGGELTVISGKTKHGKTLLAQTFTRNMGSNMKPLWFTYEVRTKQFISQFGENVPEFYLPKKLKQNDTVWLEERILEGILKYGCKVVFLDNTHNVLNLTGDNLTHKIDEFVKRVKEIAVRHNIHFFLLHHISKSDVGRVEDLNSNLLRDSSMIPQTADNVFFIWRDDMGAWLKITENRREGVFNKSVRLVKVGCFFEEVTEIDVYESSPRKMKRRRDVDE